ncbi:NAC domain-containing protein 72-like [Cornus florida]|uniref:NAC domain-containing protein 72-like n=1 Tax=Cornus florida TaxID=4283 RepID=UPI0028998105|nr:NAC domain-containing protein 72-like [Cornus florida]
MGDPKNPRPASFSLPPGCRFYPSEDQLVCYYLTSKNTDDGRFGFDYIREIDLYGHDPFDLPESACFRFGRGGRKRHWYCYTARVSKERGRRRAGGGYWKSSGRVRDVVGAGAGKVVVGTRRTFVFYLGNSPKTAKRTDFVMYEYALIDHHEASFVLCRIFVKSHGVNNISEHGLSSCGEESVATVRHIGIQYDGTVHDDNSVERKNEVLGFPMGLADELDDRVPAEAVAVASFQLPSNTQPNEPVMSSGLSGNGTVFIDDLATQQLIAILEEDYIQLDDLLCPLSGIDNT